MGHSFRYRPRPEDRGAVSFPNMSSPPYRAVSVYHGFPQLGIDPRRHAWCTVSTADRLLEPGSVAERKAVEHWTHLAPDWRWSASGLVVCSRAYVETRILRAMNVPTDDEIALTLVDFPRNVPPPTASLFWETVHSLGVLESLARGAHTGQAAKIWKAIRAGIRDPPARDSSDEATMYFTDVFVSQLGDDPSRQAATGSPPGTQPLRAPGGPGSSQLLPIRRSFRTDITHGAVHATAMKIMHSLFGSAARAPAPLPPYSEAVAILVACEALFPCKPDQDDASSPQWQASRPHARSLDAAFPELALPTRLLSWMRGAVDEGETNLWPIQVWSSRAVMAALSTAGPSGLLIEGSVLHTAQDVRDLEAKAMHRGRILAARAWFGTADDLCKKIYITGTGWRTRWQRDARRCVSDIVAGGAFADMICCLTAYGCMSHRKLLFWHALCRLGELCGVPATRWLPRDPYDATPGMPDVFVHDGLSLASDIRRR